MLNHSTQSHMVSNWRKPHESLHMVDDLLNQQGESFTLKSPLTGYVVSVTFTTLKSDPDKMVVRATNWAAEDEPNGIYKTTDCRAFYKNMLKAGFAKA